VYVQQCDGVSPSTPSYTVSEHCDLASGNTPVNANASGAATFDASDPTARLNVFKGKSPQELFNCLSPNDPALSNGLSNFRNCQVRVSGGTPADTTEQAFFTIVLPDAVSGTTTSSSSSSTTAVPPPNPICGMGAGIPQPAPKPPKNSGLVKLSKGLVTAPAIKDTKWKFTGTADSCVNFPTAVKTGTPITSGSVKVQVELPPGATCSNVAVGTAIKASWQVKWNAIDPGTGKVKSGVAKDKGKTIASFVRVGSGIPLTLRATTPAIVDPKSIFIGKHLSMDFVIDESQSALDTAFNDVKGKGIALLHFTNVLGPSSITVLP
jgi:hypothetical protein